MELKRRQFLKMLGLAAAGIAFSPKSLLPQEHKHQWHRFDPRQSCGDCIFATDGDYKTKKFAVELFDAEIRKFIPPKYRRNIKWIVQAPVVSRGDPFTQRYSICWKYSPRA